MQSIVELCKNIAKLLKNNWDIDEKPLPHSCMHTHCNIDAKSLRHCFKSLRHWRKTITTLLKTIATFVLNHFDICAKPLRHLCKTIATFVQNHRNICAKPLQHLCKTITTFVQNQCKPIGQHWRIDAKYCKIIFFTI